MTPRERLFRGWNEAEWVLRSFALKKRLKLNMGCRSGVPVANGIALVNGFGGTVRSANRKMLRYSAHDTSRYCLNCVKIADPDVTSRLTDLRGVEPVEPDLEPRVAPHQERLLRRKERALVIADVSGWVRQRSSNAQGNFCTVYELSGLRCTREERDGRAPFERKQSTKGSKGNVACTSVQLEFLIVQSALLHRRRIFSKSFWEMLWPVVWREEKRGASL